jgi:hypothetical protein
MDDAARHLAAISQHLDAIATTMKVRETPITLAAAAPSMSPTPAVPAPPLVQLRAPVRAADLDPHQVAVDGSKGTNRRGNYPAMVLANIPGAIEMRLGNTHQEMTLSEWRPYAAETVWLVRSGRGTRTVYAEYRRADGSVFATSAVVPPHNDADKSDYTYPISDVWEADGHHVTEVMYREDFSTNQGRWSAYDWHAGARDGGGNTFYPASWSSEGYAWVDDSRWRIDWPEQPPSILALVNHFAWHGMCRNGIDLRGAAISFDLRGIDLDLKGGHADLFVNDLNGARHKIAQPLALSNDRWSHNEVIIDDTGWASSWQNGNDADVDPFDITGFGIAFRGFGTEPSGRLAIDNVVIRTAAPGRLVHSLDGTCAIVSQSAEARHP